MKHSATKSIPAVDGSLRLSAVNLKTALWETLQAIRLDLMQPGQGDAIASQAREILRTTKVQLQISQQAKRGIPLEVIEFAERE